MALNGSLTALADLSSKDYSQDQEMSNGNDVCLRFGKRLKALRKQKGWSQVYTAVHLGLDRSYISDIETGKKQVCIRSMEVIADGFGISMAQLVSRL
jgi:ribosome-binding protein aMBF1 (putative translation factor)